MLNLTDNAIKQKLSHDLLSIYSTSNAAFSQLFDEDKDIAERAKSLLIRSLDKLKTLASSLDEINLALIDDDSLVIDTWELMASRNNLKLASASTTNNFLKLNVPKDVPVFIDKNLSNGVSGFDVADELHNLGFKKLYIITGEVSENKELTSNNVVCGIFTKDFPGKEFWL